MYNHRPGLTSGLKGSKMTPPPSKKMKVKGSTPPIIKSLSPKLMPKKFPRRWLYCTQRRLVFDEVADGVAIGHSMSVPATPDRVKEWALPVPMEM